MSNTRSATYWISEHGATECGSWSRGLGKVITRGGPENALAKARIMWPDALHLSASAMSAGTAETPTEAQGEARQRGGEAETPKEHRP